MPAFARGDWREPELFLLRSEESVATVSVTPVADAMYSVASEDATCSISGAGCLLWQSWTRESEMSITQCEVQHLWQDGTSQSDVLTT